MWGDWKKNKERRRERHNSVAVSKRRSSYSASVLDGIIELYVFSLSIHNGVNSRILRTLVCSAPVHVSDTVLEGAALL